MNDIYYVIGAGGAGIDIAMAMKADGVNIGLVDDEVFGEVFGVSVDGNLDWALSQKILPFLIGIANCEIRKLIWEKLSIDLLPISFVSTLSLRIHPESIIIGIGSVIMPEVRFTSNAIIGENSFIHYGCHLSHGTKIGSHCVLMPNVTITSGVYIGDSVFVGAGTLITKPIKIKDGTVIPPNSVLDKDVI